MQGFGELLNICQVLYGYIMDFGDIVFTVFFTPINELYAQFSLMDIPFFGSLLNVALNILNLISPKLLDVTPIALLFGFGFWFIVIFTLIKWLLDLIK